MYIYIYICCGTSRNTSSPPTGLSNLYRWSTSSHDPEKRQEKSTTQQAV